MALFVNRTRTKQQDLDLAKKTKISPKRISKTGNTLEDTCNKVREVLDNYKDNYGIIKDKKELENVITTCIKDGICSIDTETTGKNAFTCPIVGISIYSKSNKAFYIPLNHRSFYTKERIPSQLPLDFVAEQFKRLKDTKVIWHNARFDLKVFKINLGIEMPLYWDTLPGANLLDENEEHGLKYLYYKYIEPKNEFFTFGDLFDDMNFGDIPVDVAFIYASHDAYMTYKLWEYQYEIFTRPENKDLYDLLMKIEIPIVKVAYNMEMRGIELDKDYTNSLIATYQNYLKEAQSKFYKELSKYDDLINSYMVKNPGKLSTPFKYTSPVQLAILLYDILKIEPVSKKTPRGTGEEILEKINLPICKIILECRGYEKLLNTYILKLPEVLWKDNSIHANFNTCGTVTGRFSSSDPNLQNIPSHDKYVRKMFKARDGYVLEGFDYSQQEVRILAQVTHDEDLIKAYKEGKDIYSWFASMTYHLPYEECLEFRPDGTTNYEAKERRSRLKAIVLGIMYSKTSKSIAQDLNITQEEADNIFNTFFKTFHKVKKFMDDTQQMAREKGYVKTIWGRKRHLPEMQLEPYEVIASDGYIEDFDPFNFSNDVSNGLSDKTKKYWQDKMKNATTWKQKQQVIDDAKKIGLTIKDNTYLIQETERQCVNSVIQGSAGEMTKLSMINIDNNEELRKLDFHLLLTIHDEVIGECPRENATKCKELLKKIMVESPAEKIKVPMKCDVSITTHWTSEELDL